VGEPQGVLEIKIWNSHIGILARLFRRRANRPIYTHMANKRPSIAVGFLAILGLGAVAVAIVAIALSLAASSAQRVNDASREAAAVDLLEQRHAVAAPLAAEQAAAVMDLVGGDEAQVSASFTAQRITALENALIAVAPIADRTDTVGNEARRWLAALDTPSDPAAATDPFARLIAYEDFAQIACCAGKVGSDGHHTDTLRSLESAASASSIAWELFYVAAEVASRQPPSLPTVVDQFLEHMGTATRLPPDTALFSEQLAANNMPTLISLEVAGDGINQVLTSEPVATLDRVVLVASGRATTAVTIEEAFVAADAAYRSLDELYAAALENTREVIRSEIDSAERIRLLATVLTPLLLIALVGIGFTVYRSAKQREQALEHEQDLIDARNRFMRMVSHELRTPATAISGFAQMLSREWTSLTDAEITEFLRIVDRQSTHLSLIVDDLLTLSHLETGRLRLHLGVVNLAEAAADAIAMVDGRYDIEVTTSIDPEQELLADSDRLVQILRNLVENAAKYGRTGVEVTATATGDQCEILVSDTGPGVPPEAAERIFKFWDRGVRDGPGARGHGMGLAIARHLSRAMVGDLLYRPNQPFGSVFVLTLPLAVPPELNLDEQTSAGS
jgi:signal transduction histidine kinase